MSFGRVADCSRSGIEKTAKTFCRTQKGELRRRLKEFKNIFLIKIYVEEK